MRGFPLRPWLLGTMLVAQLVIAFSADAQSVSVRLRNQNGVDAPVIANLSPRFITYRRPSFAFVAQTQGSNPATFNLGAGDYAVEGYATGAPILAGLQEFWGDKWLTMPGTSSVIIDRNFPYASAYFPPPSTIVLGGSATFTIRVINRVPTSIATDLAVNVRLVVDRSRSSPYDDFPGCDQTSGTIRIPGSGGTRDFQLSVNPTTTGQYYYAIIVRTATGGASLPNTPTDSSSWVSAFHVTAPDLVIEDISISPAAPVVGDTVTISAVVFNQGTANAPQFSIRYRVDGGSIGTDSLTFGLNAGSRNTETIAYTASASGTHQVCVDADHLAQVVETFDTNNTSCEYHNWQPPDDHGNSSGTATIVSVGPPASGIISPAGDPDWFAFDAQAGYHYWFETTLLGLTDSVLTLFGTNGATQLYDDDDSGPGLASRIDWNCPASGRYYLRVRGYGDTATGAYRVSLTKTTLRVPTTKGITVLVHGYRIEGNGLNPVTEYWDNNREFITSVLRAFGGGRIAVYDRTSASFQPFADPDSEVMQKYTAGGLRQDTGETVLVHNWAIKSNDDEAGHAEEAADALFAALVNGGYVDPQAGTSTHPLHFIGHSRGCSVISETIQRLGAHGINVHYATSLDPHDFDEDLVPDDDVFHDPATQVWNNVHYADNFWQDYDGPGGIGCVIPNPDGRSLGHLQVGYEHNYYLDSIAGFTQCGGHSKVVTWYLGTIAPGSQPAGWYTDALGTDAGFSRWLARGGYGSTNPTGEGFAGGLAGRAVPRNPSVDGHLLPYHRPDTTNHDDDGAAWDFFNGTFNLRDLAVGGQLGSGLAGWYYHQPGGQGCGSEPQLGGIDGDRYLLLDNSHRCARHNWFYLRPDADHLTFLARVDMAVPGTAMRVSIEYPEVSRTSLSVSPLLNTAQTSGFQSYTASIPQALRGQVVMLIFEVTANGSALAPKVGIDDISIGTCVAPTITSQPASATRCTGGSAGFTVIGTGSPAPSFQWRRGSTNLSNGGNISGATSASLVINPVGTGNAAADYNCVLTNSCGNATTSNATLAVNVAPTITSQPSDLTRCTGTSVTFAVAATGTPAPTYQWRRNGMNIPGATDTTYHITSVVPGDGGRYDCIVTNSCGSVTSSAAELTVLTAPLITESPVSQIISTGGTVGFSVTATGTPSPTHQWRKNTVDIGGATSSTFTIGPVVPGDAGSYDCVVSNTCGSAPSQAALLAVESCPSGWTQGPYPAQRPPTFGHAATYDAARHQTLIFGGSNGTSFSTLWAFGGNAGAPSWSELVSMAEVRSYAVMAFDALRGRAVLFGGVNYPGGVSTPVGDTWEWNGRYWNQQSVSSHPSARWLHMMAYDAVNHRTILFGGANSDQSEFHGDTWAWDGTGWTQIPTFGPSPRGLSAMAFDEHRGVIVLHGGRTSAGPNGEVIGDTWEFNVAASTWAQVSRFGPPARSEAAMVYDPTHQRVVLFGGRNGSTAFDDTWEWNGTTWFLRPMSSPMLRPTPRLGHAMTFDTRLGKAIVVSGLGWSNGWVFESDTWLLGETCCRADLDNGSGSGARDGAVDIDDLLYFIAQFGAGSLAADLDDGSGLGYPDDGVTIDDLLFFLTHFEAGC